MDIYNFVLQMEEIFDDEAYESGVTYSSGRVTSSFNKFSGLANALRRLLINKNGTGRFELRALTEAGQRVIDEKLRELGHPTMESGGLALGIIGGFYQRPSEHGKLRINADIGPNGELRYKIL